MLTTGQTSTTRMFSVFSNTTMAVTYMATMFSCVAESRRHLKWRRVSRRSTRVGDADVESLAVLVLTWEIRNTTEITVTSIEPSFKLVGFTRRSLPRFTTSFTKNIHSIRYSSLSPERGIAREWMALHRNIDHVIFGQYDIVTWFYSPYPEELIPTSGLLPKLYVCPQCFKYTTNETAAAGHQVNLFIWFCL